MSEQVTLTKLLQRQKQSIQKPKSKKKSTPPFESRPTDLTEPVEEGTHKKRRVMRGTSKRVVKDVPCDNEVPIEKRPPPGASFKTAREKRIEDHYKKYGHSEDAYKPSFLTRKPPSGGSKSKFKPPSARGAPTEATDETQSLLSTRTLELLSAKTGEVPSELKNFDLALVEAVCSEILDEGAAVQWEDIAGQDTAKQLVQEMVVWPMMNPHLFQGTRAPPRGLLLFGPPGTGKTLIGRAIASNISATFFSISASSLTSKWIGEGEKMVRILFAVAAALQPTVIFIDEIDSILSARKSDGEHESSRRIKTELLIQMDGCNPNNAHAQILVVAATNRPQELDEAARRRLPKQLYIPLPCEIARRIMIESLLRAVKFDLSERDFAKIVEKTDGYSGADMRSLIQEACQGPIRELFKRNGANISTISEDALRPIRIRDFQVAARAQKPSVDPSEIQHYIAYNAKHGAKIADVPSECEDDW